MYSCASSRMCSWEQNQEDSSNMSVTNRQDTVKRTGNKMFYIPCCSKGNNRVGEIHISLDGI